MKKNTLIAAAAASAAGFVLYENYTLETERFVVSSPRIPGEFDGFRILQLSDFHCKSFGGKNQYLYRKIDEIAPDMIVMTGDMVSREAQSLDPFLRLCKYLGRRYSVYYTIGNHELDLSDRTLEAMFAALRGYGITILSNERAAISRGGASINLYGMWYSLHYYKNKYNNYRKHLKFDQAEMIRLMGNCDASRYSILLAHNPLDFEVYSHWGADLTFSGHIHGGVIRLGRYGGLLSPGRRLFPEYFAGEYQNKNGTLLVSRGLGGPRLLNRPHLLVATLKSDE